MKNNSPLFITGIPGSGKTTHAKWLTGKLCYNYFSSGDFARRLIQSGHQGCIDALGKGSLAPIENELKEIIEEFGDRYIIDGFPRTYDQYLWVKDTWEKPKILVLGISRETVYKRMKERKRENTNVIRARIFNESLNFTDSPFVTIENSEKPIEEVRERILKWLEKVN